MAEIAEMLANGRSYKTLLQKVHSMNILSSDYLKKLYGLKSYHEVIDEIYNQVNYVEPWIGRNCRGPSTAYCLLYHETYSESDAWAGEAHIFSLY